MCIQKNWTLEKHDFIQRVSGIIPAVSNRLEPEQAYFANFILFFTADILTCLTMKSTGVLLITMANNVCMQCTYTVIGTHSCILIK